MSSAPRRSARRNPVQESLQAGALVGGLFLSLLGVLRGAMRLHLLPRNDLAVLLPVAILVVLLPLGVGLKLGFRDETPPALRAYRHALPWSRSPTEELLGAVLGGAFWAAIGMGLGAILERTVPVVAIGAIATAIAGPSLAAWSLVQVHGRRWTKGRAAAVLFGVTLLLAAPQLAVGPRGPLGSSEGWTVLAREHFDLAERFPGNEQLKLRGLALALRGCQAGQARACVLGAFAHTTRPRAPEESDALLRRACDLTSTDLGLCARYVGDGFSTQSSSCSVESRCTAGHGVECRGLLACQQSMAPAGLTAACARREAGQWREVWCGIVQP